MWSTFFVADEGTVGPGAAAGAAPGGAPQGAGGLAGLMSGRSTFGGGKRRRTTSTGPAMSEAQEGKVMGLMLCECVFSLQRHNGTLQQMERTKELWKDQMQFFD